MVDIAGKPFTQLTNLNILDELRINGVLVLPGGGQDIVEVTDDYDVQQDDDIINCNGTFMVTLPPIAIAIKEITISSTNGIITLAADATIEGAGSVPNQTSITFYPARGQWWIKN